MFFPNDTTTEIVAHFLGYFELAVEGMRTRLTYEEILADAKLPPDEPGLEQLSADVAQKFALGGYEPGVVYTPPTWLIRGDGRPEAFAAPTPSISIPPQEFVPELPPLPQQGFEPPPAPLIGTEPGSVIAILTQQIVLSDNDVVVLGDYDGPLVFHSGASAGITLMHDAATAISEPITGISALHDAGDVSAFVEQVAEIIDAMATSEAPADTTINTTEAIEGTYVNGEVAEEAPDLMEALPEHWIEAIEDPEAEATTARVSIAGDEVADSVTLDAGGNLLVNEAAVFNGGLTSAVFAVAGSYHQLDAIVQTNAYFDTDVVADGSPGAAGNVAGATQAFNIAIFEQETRDATGDAAEANPGVMPSNWQISVVTGDMIFVEWMMQYTFQSDQDIAVLSSTGATTTVTSGENVGLNSISFANIGLYYDLILIGGDLYDANIVVQTNVLYDNDTIDLLGGGDAPAGNGSLATSGNLLWNQASILNIGPTEFQTGLPGHYSDAMEGLDAGNSYMPAGFETDSMFEGVQLLRVLYIAGDVYDLRYIQQTNVLGDADYVAFEMAELLGNSAGTEFHISTGANALVNTATVVDYDALGDTAYVGGDVYTDAILIQADIIMAGSDDPGSDALVTEVIAFLEVDDAGDMSMEGEIGPTPPPADGPPADIMQSVLA